MPTTTPLTEIEELAKALSVARDTLTDRVGSLHEELTTIRNRKLPGIKAAVAATKEAESKLEQAILASPDLFQEPRTIVVHGLRVGFAKGRGKIEWADEATVIAKIEKLFAEEQVKLLVKVEKSVRKKALGALSTDELKRIGCTIRAAGDYVYIEGVADTIEKLITRLLKEDESEE